MKILNILLLILFIGVSVILAQSSDSMTPEKLEGFVDLNANGIDDRIENAGKGKGKGKKQPKDRFVDMDGDGICDGKESAIGLKKLYRKRKGNPHR